MIVLFILLSGLSREGFSFNTIRSSALQSTINIFAAYISGAVFSPLLLPVIPCRSFSLKGAITGFLTVLFLYTGNYLGDTIPEVLSWILFIPAVSSYLAMNFTGASTYTSLSGVKKEMRIAVPLQIIALTLGLGLYILSKFL